MGLTEREKVTLKRVRLENLKRRYAKMIKHPEFVDECIELKSDIDALELELAMM